MFSCSLCEDNFPSAEMCLQHLHNKHKWVREKPFSCLGLHQGKAKRFPSEFLVFKHEMRCGQYTHKLDELGIPPIQLADVDRWRGDLEHMAKRLQAQEWASSDDISVTVGAVNSMEDAAAYIFAPADFRDMNSYLFPAKPEYWDDEQWKHRWNKHVEKVEKLVFNRDLSSLNKLLFLLAINQKTGYTSGGVNHWVLCEVSKNKTKYFRLRRSDAEFLF